MHRLQDALDYSTQRTRARIKFNQQAFVYIIRCVEFVKVGVSDNPIKRINEMQTGNPYPLKLVHNWPTMDAYSAERCLHAELSDKHHAGEWFRMTDEEVTALIARYPTIDSIIPPDGDVL